MKTFSISSYLYAYQCDCDFVVVGKPHTPLQTFFRSKIYINFFFHKHQPTMLQCILIALILTVSITANVHPIIIHGHYFIDSITKEPVCNRQHILAPTLTNQPTVLHQGNRLPARWIVCSVRAQRPIIGSRQMC